MSETTKSQEILRRYTDQPDRLPDRVRALAERAWGGDEVQLYAFADLNASLELEGSWLLLGSQHAAVVEQVEGGEPSIQSFPRSKISKVVETPGLSSTQLAFLNGDGQTPLAMVRYSQRQRQAFGSIAFVLRQQTEGQPVELEGADQSDSIYADAVTKPIREAQASVNPRRLTIVWRLLSYLKPYRRQVAIGMTGAVLMTLVSLTPPFLTGFVIDHVITPHGAGTISSEQAMKLAIAVIVGIATVYILREISQWIRLRFMAVLGEHVARDLRRNLYDHLHRLSVSYFSSKQTGSIISRVSSDTDRIWDFFAFGVVEVSLSALMLIGLGGVLIFLDWPLGLLMTLPVPLLLWAMMLNGRQMQGLFLRAWRKWSNMTEVLSDTIPGIRVVKAFNQEDHERDRFHNRNSIVTAEFNRIHDSWTTFWPLLLLGLHIMTILVWAVAVPRILHGGGGWMPDLTPGIFVSFLLYMGMFFQPIEIFGQMVRMMNRSITSAHRIFEVLDTEPDMTEKPDAVKLNPIEGRVTFDRVTFGYDPVRQILKGISFDVQPGEMIGLVGPSGAGKTTVINLIARFYDVLGGEIRIDGVPVQDLDLGDYRRQIGMVLQDPYLFHGSIVENIRYGMPEATVEEVVEASRAANAHEFICRLPHGYDTIVGERGHTLSGGERQRVSIARAILHNPRVLILDEATSSVDTETEKKIQEALDRLVKGRTTFAIAHRLSTLTRASRLFVFKEGRLVEQGTHADLLAKEEGVYRKLHKIQQELHEYYAI